MTNENYKLYIKHKVEIFDMIYDVVERSPCSDKYCLFFGWESEKDEEEWNKKMKEYLEIEKPKIDKRLRELGFNFK